MPLKEAITFKRGDLVQSKTDGKYYGIVLASDERIGNVFVFLCNGLTCIKRKEYFNKLRICESDTCGYANFNEILASDEVLDKNPGI